VNGTLYRALVAVVCAAGMTAGLAYGWLYRPSQWRSADARDSSAWVLALTLFFAWSLFRVLYGIWWGPGPEPVGLLFSLSSLAIGLLLVALVLYRLHRFRVAMLEEREHPTKVCTRCKGRGVLRISDATQLAKDGDLPNVRRQGPGGALPQR
jgi:hypothetical protein